MGNTLLKTHKYYLHKKNYLVEIILFLFQLSNPLIGQELYFRHFDVKDGLASSTVYHAFQDSKGFIWFGTDAGVSRYNGYTFENFSIKDGLSDNEVFEIFEDSKQRIWFRTFNGKISYFYRGIFYNSLNTPLLELLDFPSTLTCIMEDTHKNIWLASERDGIVCFENSGKVKRYFKENNSHSRVLFLYQCEHNRILASVAEQGIWDVLENKVVSPLSELNLGYEGITNCRYNYIGYNQLLLSHDTLITTYKKKLYLYSCVNPTLTTIHLTDTISKVLSISNAEKKGHVWINTSKGTYRWPALKLKQYLKDKPVAWTMVDKEKNTWITTLGKGIYLGAASDIVYYNEKNGLPVAESYCMEVDSLNTLWIGQAQTFLSSIKGGKIKYYCVEDSPSTSIQRTVDICITNNAIWLANDFGVLKFQKNKLKPVGYGGNKSIIQADEKLYIARAEGLFVVPEKSILQGLSTGYHHLQKARLSKVFKDKNRKIWMGLANGLKISSVKDSFSRLEKNIPKLTGRVSDIEETSAAVWVSTQNNGLYAVKNYQEVVHFTEADGLSSSVCNNLCIQSEDVLWIATNKGLDRLSTKNGKISIENFDVNDGLVDNEIRDVCIIGDTVWLATTKGVSTFPKNYKKAHFDIPVYITGFYVSGKRRAYWEPSTVLNHDENNIKLDFIGLSHRHQGKPLIYRYKFVKNDTVWHYTRNTSVEFPYLSSRAYEFKVQVQNSDGTWSTKSASINFLIKTPIWKSNLFYVLIGFFLATMLASIFYIQIRRKKKNEELITQTIEAELTALRAQMEPHFFSNALNFLQSLLQKDKAEASEKYLLKFIQHIRSTLYNSSSEFISIREEIKTLQNYLELYQMGETKFCYRIDVDPKIDQEHTLVPSMLAQPLIENSIKHGIYGIGGKGKIDVRYILTRDYILLEVQDNGIGIKKAMEMKLRLGYVHQSFAIRSIQKRLNLLQRTKHPKFQLILEETKDETGNSVGTKASIIMPYTIDSCD